MLIKEERMARLKWQMGKIEQVQPGPDGVVRTCLVKVPEDPEGRKWEYLRRPANLLVPLECAEEAKE